jgi:hypothetical protein
MFGVISSSLPALSSASTPHSIPRRMGNQRW